MICLCTLEMSCLRGRVEIFDEIKVLFYYNFGASSASLGAFWSFVYYRMFIVSFRFLLVIFIAFRLLITTRVLTLVPVNLFYETS